MRINLQIFKSISPNQGKKCTFIFIVVVKCEHGEKLLGNKNKKNDFSTVKYLVCFYFIMHFLLKWNIKSTWSIFLLFHCGHLTNRIVCQNELLIDCNRQLFLPTLNTWEELNITSKLSLTWTPKCLVLIVLVETEEFRGNSNQFFTHHHLEYKWPI